MKYRTALSLAVCLVLAATSGACLKRSPRTDFDPCNPRLPETNNMSVAITRAEEVLQECPDIQQDVFLYLLEVGQKNPGVQNRVEILDLYESLIKYRVINVREAEEMLTRYLYVRFAAVDRIQERFSSLSDRALTRLSHEIEDELAFKKVGLQEVSGATDQYERAREYAQRMQDLLESTRIQWNYLRNSESQ